MDNLNTENQEVQETQEKSVVNHWDSIILQINEGNEGTGLVRIMKHDIEDLMKLHNVSRGDILELLLQALETTPKEEMIAK